MNPITSSLVAAKTMVQATRSKLNSLQPLPPPKSNADIISERNRLKHQLSVVPPYAREAIQEEFDLINANARVIIIKDYDARWENMSVEDKKAVLQEIYERVADELGIDPLNLKFSDLSSKNLSGLYNDGDGRFDVLFGQGFGSNELIKIDTNHLENGKFYDVMTTVAHEARHQYQEYLIDHPEERPPHISEEQLEAWKREDDLPRDRKPNMESDAEAYEEEYAKIFYEEELDNYSG